MANFNYLDFFKTPTISDTKLFIKNINNEVVWSIAPFKIKSSIIQNNNIRINFTNNDFVLIDFNNVYESKIALTNLQSAINVLNNKTPLNIDKDVELWVDNKIQGITGAFSTLVAYNTPGYTYSIVNTPSSFTILAGTYSYLSYVETLESYDNSQGVYLQATIPTPIFASGSYYLLELGITNQTNNTSYFITIENNPYFSQYPTYVMLYNYDELYTATFSESFRFSLYSDGYNVFYGINGQTVCSTTYSNDSYYFKAGAIETEIDLTITNVEYYPTGKKGYADKYYSTSDTFITIPPVDGAVVLQTQPNLSYTPGQWLLISNSKDNFYTVGDYDDDDIVGTNFFAEIDQYDINTGNLIVVCQQSNSIGSTASFWYINLTGASGISMSGDSYFNGASFSRISTTYSVIMSDSRIYMDGGYSLRFTDYDQGGIGITRQLIRAWDTAGPLNFDDIIDDTDYERAQLSFDLEDTQKSSISLHSFDWTSYTYSIDYELKFYNGEISSLFNNVATGSVINQTTLKGTTTFQQTEEVVNTSQFLGTSPSTISYDFNLGSIWYHNDLSADYIPDFINVPTTNNRAITTTIIINQGATVSMITSPIFINGSTYSIKWGNGISPVGNIEQTDVVGLTFITYNNAIAEVLGQLSTYSV